MLDNANPDDPENYQVKKEKSRALPAVKNNEAGPAQPELHYIRYQIKEAKEGAGAFDTGTGRYPKAVKHVQRDIKAPDDGPHLTPSNRFPALRQVDTKKTELICIPTNVLDAHPVP